MIWADDTHDFSCTACRHCGGPCPAAARMAERLVSALRLSGPFTADDFEITGAGRLTGCSRSCNALYVAGKTSVRIYCDVAEEADIAALERFAAAFFGPGTAGIALSCAGLEQIPCAMVQALPHGR
jgi:predicted metal-binding protein